MPDKTATPAENRDRLYAILKEFSTAMLVSRGSDGLPHARPLAVAKLEADGRAIFATSLDSAKISEIVKEPRVCLTFQRNGAYASLSGEAVILHDRALIDELWSETWKLWFPEGKDAPDLCLLEIDANRGEYWNNEGVQGVKFAFDAVRAWLKGEQPPMDQARNAKVGL